MAPEPLSKGVWWNTPSGALLPQVARVDYAQDLAQPRSKRSSAVRRATRDFKTVRSVSILIKAHAEQQSRSRAALAETYPSTSDGEGHRRGAVLQTPAPLVRSGFRGHPATRLQTRV